MEVKRMHYNGCYEEREALGAQADELMIANMLNVLNNPSLAQMLDDEELKNILSVIKNHVVLKAGMTLEVQEKFINNNGRSR